MEGVTDLGGLLAVESGGLDKGDSVLVAGADEEYVCGEELLFVNPAHVADDQLLPFNFL
jgi:hypothetical protein